MITTLEEFYQERYQALEIELLGDMSRRMGKEFKAISATCMEQWQRILKEALAVQAEERIPCAYMSISLLNTSLLGKKPMLQVDFYNGDWVYGEPWARGRMSAKFLFHEWDAFCRKALDESFYVRNKLQGIAIKSLFWETAERMIYLFSCFAKYFARELGELPEFKALEKEPVMYVTCGTYLDWQERIYAILPELDLRDIPENEQTAFREFRGETYKGLSLQAVDLRHCRFYDCVFRNCVFDKVNLSDGYFHNCRFRNTEFVELGMAGCLWEDSAFSDCSFRDSGTHAEGDEYFAEAEMVRVGFSDVKAINCDFSHFRLKDCREMKVSLAQVKAEDSDWAKYVEVKPHG